MTPRISVVIPTRGRRHERLRAALEAVAAQEGLGPDELEVIVAADPGVAVPPAPPAGVAATPAITLRTVHADAPASAAAKRNLAWPLAQAPLVAFTDDDCVPAPEWAKRLLAVHERRPTAFVQGRTLPDPAEVDDLWGLAVTQWIERDSPWQETCNIAYPRDLLERLNGFDEGYGELGGEDTDLGQRALAAGAGKVYDPRALVWHAVERRSFRRAIREAFRTRDQPQVLARFPHLRRELVLNAFYRAEHAWLALAVAGAVTRRPAFAALAATPYVELHLRHYRLSPPSVIRACTHLPVRVAVDAIETAVVFSRGARRGVLAL